MKNLIIAFCSLAVMIGGWLIFVSYSEAQINAFTSAIEDEIIPAVESSEWQLSMQQISLLDEAWHMYKNKAIYFLDTDTINEIDYSLAKSIKYIKAEDVSNSSGELNAMIEQLTFLCKNDELILGNIF